MVLMKKKRTTKRPFLVLIDHKLYKAMMISIIKDIE